MGKFLLAFLMVVALAGVSFAAVSVFNDGTKVDLTENLNIVGGAVSTSAGAVTVSTLLSAMDVDTTLYTKAAGTGGVKHVVISADGTIYATNLY